MPHILRRTPERKKVMINDRIVACREGWMDALARRMIYVYIQP